MARSSTTRSITVRREVHRFFWPGPALQLWQLVMLATGGVQIGVFAAFMGIQSRFGVGTPWLFPYAITVGALCVAFVVFVNIYAIVNKLVPFPVILCSFILFVLFLTGLIETGVQLFGPGGNVHGNCQTYVIGRPESGPSLGTLAWLEQQSICNSWYASFAFWFVGLAFLGWMIVIAIVVNQRSYYD